MNYDVSVMLNIYGTYEFDWLGDKIRNVNYLTRHHIIKKEDGGENGISNYALLTSKSHRILHLLEEIDHDSYDLLNNMFLELNRSLNPPDSEYYRGIEKIIRRSIRNNKMIKKMIK